MSYFGGASRNGLGIGIGGIVSLNGGGMGNSQSVFPETLFQNGEQGFFYNTWETTYLFKDVAGTDPVTADNDAVALVVDISGVGINATQATLGDRPLFDTDNGELQFNTTAKSITSGTLPALTNMSYVLATDQGVVEYKVTKSAATFIIGGQYMPSRNVFGAMIIDRSLTVGELTEVYDYFVSAGSQDSGAGAYALVNNFSGFWRGWTYLVVFPEIDTNSGTIFNTAWLGCSGLTTFPSLSVGNGEQFQSTWSGCTGLTSFPLLDFSSAINLASAWSGCAGLTSFPLIVTNIVTNLASTWLNCSGLTSFPLISTSLCLSFSNAWKNCSSLTSFPLVDTSAGTNFLEAWRDCSSLTSFPALNMSSGTNLSEAWRDCTGLTTFGAITTTSATSFSGSWNGCTNLVSFPSLSTANLTTCLNAWNGCSNLTTFIGGMFAGSPCVNFLNAFLNCSLTQASVDSIVITLNANGTTGGTLSINGGANATPSAAGKIAVDALRAKSWTVTLNGY